MESANGPAINTPAEEAEYAGDEKERQLVLAVPDLKELKRTHANDMNSNSAIAEKDRVIAHLNAKIEMLELKVKKLEQLVRMKNRMIEALRNSAVEDENVKRVVAQHTLYQSHYTHKCTPTSLSFSITQPQKETKEDADAAAIHVTDNNETEEIMAPSTMQPAAAGTRPSTASTNKWHCSACTFANHADAVTCEVCGARKRMTNDADDDEGDNNTWQCAKCTLINNSESNGSRCAGCGVAKPLSFAAEVAEINTNNTNGNGNRSGSGRYLCCGCTHTQHTHCRENHNEI